MEQRMAEHRQAEIRTDEQLDDLQNGYYIIQKKQGFRFGTDAVLLSSFVRLKEEEKAIDLGTGTGILPILLAAKTPCRDITALELAAPFAEMAERSVRFDALEDRIRVVHGDIREAVSVFGTASFDVAVSNPPYMIGKHGLTNPDLPKAIARHEIYCTLEDVVKGAAYVLKDRGRFFMVHRPCRLAEIFEVLRRFRLEPKRMQLVYPYIDREPNMVLIEARKGGNPRLTVERPLIVYEKPGVYTKSILEIYHMI